MFLLHESSIVGVIAEVVFHRRIDFRFFHHLDSMNDLQYDTTSLLVRCAND